MSRPNKPVGPPHFQPCFTSRSRAQGTTEARPVISETRRLRLALDYITITTWADSIVRHVVHYDASNVDSLEADTSSLEMKEVEILCIK